LLEDTEIQSHEIEQRSDTSALIQQLANDSSFIRIFELSTVDNYVLQAYIDDKLDTTDIWVLFDSLGIDYSSAPLTVQHDDIAFEDYDDLINFIEDEYTDSLMAQYFEELQQNINTFHDTYESQLDGLDQQYLQFVFSQAFEILFNDYQQIFEDVIGFRTDECQECYDEYDRCLSDNNWDSAGIFFGILGGGTLQGGMFGSVGGPGGTLAGAAGGTLVVTPSACVAAGTSWKIGYQRCKRDLNDCLIANGCETVGDNSGSSSGGSIWNYCFECIIPT